MRVTVLELPARWGASAEALADVDARLAAGPPTDLVLLPEASLTGYVSPDGGFDADRFAEPLHGPTAIALSSLAARHGTYVVGPLIERDGPRCYNAMVGFDDGGGRVLHYRKRHPWIPETWATPGDARPPVIRIRDRAVTIAICYDGHFLATDGADLLASADLLLFPSAWVDREDSRTPLLSGLAKRFGVAVANANWSAGVVRVPGQGGSCILGSNGAALAVAPPGGRADAIV